MEGFAIELARSIMNMEIQKETILRKDLKTKRLCYCRKQILLNFISVCQLFYIRFSSKIVKFAEDRSIEKSSTKDLREWYEKAIYVSQFDDADISSKMVLISKILQDCLDENFFDEFEVKYKSVIEGIDQPEFMVNVQSLFEDINEWMENYLLNVLTLKIDCMKISDDLLTVYGIKDNFRGTQTTHPVNGCVRCTTDDCPAMIVGHDHYYKEEEIHLYMSEDFDRKDFLSKYFDIISTYHTHPENIKIVFDFMLYSTPFKLSDLQLKWIETAKEKFKCVEVINAKRLRN